MDLLEKATYFFPFSLHYSSMISLYYLMEVISMKNTISIEKAIDLAFAYPEKNICYTYSCICLFAMKNETVYIPVYGSNASTWELSLKEDAQDFLLTDNDGTIWFPAFTNPSKFKKNDNSIQLLPAGLRTILLYVCSLNHANGLVFNPYSLRLLLPKKMIKILLQAILQTKYDLLDTLDNSSSSPS